MWLTIIIPCYNCEKTINEALASCYNQGLNDFEVIAVNDGSTDNTSTILDQAAKKYPNINVINHTTNKGGGAARNTAVRNASNEVIFCLDSDDILPPNTLSKMLTLIIEKGCDGVGLHKSIKFRGKNTANIAFINEFGYVNQIIPTESLIEKSGGPFCPLYSVFMFTKKAFEVTGGYPEDHGFDTQNFAWRFLLNGLVAYTCPDTSYLHRIDFHKSYYTREYLSGKTNLNWIRIFSEFFPLLRMEIVDEIINFNINSHKNIFDQIRGFDSIFKDNVGALIKKMVPEKNTYSLTREQFYFYLFKSARFNDVKNIDLIIKNNNYKIPDYIEISGKKVSFKIPANISLKTRVIRKLKNKLKNNHLIYKAYSILISFKNNLLNIFKQKNERCAYYEKINKIIESKEMVLNIQHGGLGDWLTFTTLPRLLKERYDIKFYLSQESIDRVRNNNFYKLCFEKNPYFYGIKKTTEPFELKIFSNEKSLINFLFDINGLNLINIVESQFKLPLSKKPEIYYSPNLLDKYKNIILVDKNYISGKKLGWQYSDKKFEAEIKKFTNKITETEYIDPTKQDVFAYVDMIFSCKRFITTLSGGAALASCFDKEFSVILPSNVIGGSVDNFVFINSSGKYLS